MSSARWLFFRGLPILLMVAATSCPAPPQSITINGRVMDDKNLFLGLIPNAAIVVPDLGLGAVTDAQGRYTLTLPQTGTYHFVVCAEAYKSYQWDINVLAGPVWGQDFMLSHL